MSRSSRTAIAVLRTWGARGLARRGLHEALQRSGVLPRLENRFLARHYAGTALSRAAVLRLSAPIHGSAPDVELYGSLRVPIPNGAGWHLHPTSGHRFNPELHWSALSDADPAVGDIKDIWELGRLSWCLAMAANERGGTARAIGVVRDWIAHNPPYLGPHWMCAQETSLRGIALLTIADLARDELDASDHQAIAGVLARSVDRVQLTLRYALSQRNNHAISEAGFLWGASALLRGLPRAERLRRRAERALNEAIRDQFLPDGSYAQHSPTYQRLALHVLLWCLRVSDATGVSLPTEVRPALERSSAFLASLVAPGSEGRVPNLGGNDGALLFDFTVCPITDFRPLLAHLHAALGRPSPFGSGPWDREAEVFGYEVEHAPAEARERVLTINTHPLTSGSSHAVLRAGPLRHRPAHADALHLDVWLAGRPVAVDAGSYRYTAREPWGNALAAEAVHNLPSQAGFPQAVRAGRFFWSSWTDATVELHEYSDPPMILAELALPRGATIRRLVAVAESEVTVVDQADAPIQVRWNLAPGTQVSVDGGTGRLLGEGWSGAICGGDGWEQPEPADEDPASGWHAPTYGMREPLRAVIVPSDSAYQVVTRFSISPTGVDAGRLDRWATLDLAHVTPQAIRALLASEDRRAEA